MSCAWFNHPRLERARAWCWAVADRAAFVVESAFVANAVFWFLTWAMLSFSWPTTTREWGSFWSHYARASAAARAPVEIALLVVGLIVTALTVIIRFPKSRLAWAPWPRSRWREPGGRHPRKERVA